MPIYQAHSPELAGRETLETHAENVSKFAQAAIDSGHFHALKSQRQLWSMTSSIDDYLLLLSTLSPYIALVAEQRQALFAALKAMLKKTCGDDCLTLTGLSVLQVMQCP